MAQSKLKGTHTLKHCFAHKLCSLKLLIVYTLHTISLKHNIQYSYFIYMLCSETALPTGSKYDHNKALFGFQ